MGRCEECFAELEEELLEETRYYIDLVRQLQFRIDAVMQASKLAGAYSVTYFRVADTNTVMRREGKLPTDVTSVNVDRRGAGGLSLLVVGSNFVVCWSYLVRT